jgi:hypothetical protein
LTEEQPYHLCERCRQRVTLDDPNLVRAVEIRRVDTFGGTEYIDGMGALFHHYCWPMADYRLPMSSN